MRKQSSLELPGKLQLLHAEDSSSCLLVELEVSPEGSLGCSPSTRNHRWETVSTGNQDNHFRAGRTEETDPWLMPTLPELSASRVHPGAGSNECWELESRGGLAHFMDGKGSGFRPSARFRPILTDLRRPVNGSLEVFPREGYTNIPEEEGANFWLKCGCATGLRA